MSDNLAAALAAFQSEIPAIAKNRVADIEGRDGRRGYKYAYADLADVTAQVMPLLGKHGLAFTARPTITSEGKFILAYSLIHSSGEIIDGEYPLPAASNPQQIGSAITYARRYALCAVTGAAAEADDDGHAAAQAKPAKQPQRPQKPRTETNGHTQPAPGTANRGQVTAVQMAYQRLGFERAERDEMLSASEQIIGRTLTGPHDGRTHNNLTKDEAVKLRDTLGQFEDRGDLLAKLVEAATP